MHRAGHRWTAVAFVLLAVLGGCKKQNVYVPPPAPQVMVAQPLRQTVTPYLEATGNTVAFNQVDLVARVAGFLQDIRYKDGAAVHRGDVLFVIEPAPYQAKLQQAQAALQSAEAQATQSDAEYERQASLGRTDFASKSTVEQARAQRESNRANVTSQQGAVALAGINVGYTQVTAPFDGIVTAHQVSVGSMVGANSTTTLATIVQVDPIYVTFTVSEQDVLRIRAAMRAHGQTLADAGQIPVEFGLMTETGYPHAGTLDYVAPAIDSQTGTLLVRGVVNNAGAALLPGLFVRVRVPLVQQKADALLVPEAALGMDQTGRYVLVVDKDDTVQQRTVVTGIAVGALRAITSGLQPEDRVVVGGLQRAVPGTKVEPKPTAITADTPPAGKS